MAHAKHEQVRARYDASCGYCGVNEDDAGGELTVDHFVPTIAGGDDSDDNLVYACFRYNLFKANFHPAEQDRANGHYILHPLRDDLERHLHVDEATGRLEWRTETGRFHIVLLHLNRPALVAHRLRERHRQLLAAKQDLAETENRELRAIINAQEKYIARLNNLIENEPG